jgi:PAP2 superfamily
MALVVWLTLPLSADVVTDWNSVALDAIRAGNTPPPAAARNLAILHAAVYDAVNGIHRTHKPYLVTAMGPAQASIEAAAAAAARKVLLSLYPSQASRFETAYQDSIRRLPTNARTAQGVQWGEAVAMALLAARANDGSSASVAFPGGTMPGQWRPTVSFGGVVRPALLPHWGSVVPFALTTGTQFRPPVPPPLASPQYAAEVNFVKAIGSANSAARTPDQTQIAQFWGYGPGSATPPGHWNQIAQTVVRSGRGRDEEDEDRNGRNGAEASARLFALLNIALADAAIVSWDCKYVYNYWRPITAIQEAHIDGNAATEADPSWTPLLATPPFPEYTSGHSTFSGAAAIALAYFFDSDRVRFTVGSDDLPGVRRAYRSFSQAAFESGISRIYGGIHFSSANVHGLSTGAAVGTFVVWNFLTPLED